MVENVDKASAALAELNQLFKDEAHHLGKHLEQAPCWHRHCPGSCLATSWWPSMITSPTLFGQLKCQCAKVGSSSPNILLGLWARHAALYATASSYTSTAPPQMPQSPEKKGHQP